MEKEEQRVLRKTATKNKLDSSKVKNISKKVKDSELDTVRKKYLRKKNREAIKIHQAKARKQRLDALLSLPSGVPMFYFLHNLDDNKDTFLYKEVNPVLAFLGYNQGESSELLETNPSTLSRWKNSKKEVDIGKLRTKVFLELDEIIAKGIRIFGSEELFQEWLNTTNYSLGDVKPVNLLKDVYSISLVEEVLDALSWGDYL